MANGDLTRGPVDAEVRIYRQARSTSEPGTPDVSWPMSPRWRRTMPQAGTKKQAANGKVVPGQGDVNATSHRPSGAACSSTGPGPSTGAPRVRAAFGWWNSTSTSSHRRSSARRKVPDRLGHEARCSTRPGSTGWPPRRQVPLRLRLHFEGTSGRSVGNRSRRVERMVVGGLPSILRMATSRGTRQPSRSSVIRCVPAGWRGGASEPAERRVSAPTSPDRARNPSVAIGTVFEGRRLVGVELFGGKRGPRRPGRAQRTGAAPQRSAPDATAQ